MADYLTFMKEARKSFNEIGAMVPSSPALARDMVRPIEAYSRPLNILEVGPGTGPFTKRILRLMGPKDRLTICEINPKFLQALRENLERKKYFRRQADRVKFVCGPVQELLHDESTEKFDVIVSSLPFTNFDPSVVDEVLSLFEELLAPDGSITFCEYIGVRRLRSVFSKAREKVRLRGVNRVIQKWCGVFRDGGKVRKHVALLNIPPAFTFEFSRRAPTPVQASRKG